MRYRWLRYVVPTLLVMVPMTVFAEPSFGDHDVRTVFYIAKSNDRNRVDYGIHLDADCQPIGTAPVYAYWHRFEPSQPVFGDLNMFDNRAYGIASQSVQTRSSAGTWTEMRINALPDVRVLILTQHTAHGCIARARMPLNSRPAYVASAFVQLAGPLSVEHVTFRGVDVQTRQPVSERRAP